MVVADLIPVVDSEKSLIDLLRAGVLCNDADLSPSGEIIGTATEAAILHAAIKHQLKPETLREEWPRTGEIPFNSARKRMSTLHRTPEGEQVIFVKGATEAIVTLCTEIGFGRESAVLDESAKANWIQQAESLAVKGRRALAMAMRTWEHDGIDGHTDGVESSLNLLGLVGIIDLPCPEAAQSIARCRSAGIRPVMITGDHRGTAKAISEELDLWRPGDEILTGTQLDRLSDEELQQRARRVSVYARVSPEHKLRIVRAHQANESVVSMTGDGVNDAPALKQADIGVAMGITGTDVAKEASEMVLADDNFATIIAAVEEGRVVFDNIRKFVRLLLTANAGEILVLLFAILLGLDLPLLPVHILWINLVTDGLPALALGFEPAEENMMMRSPRHRTESIFAGGMVWGIVLLGLWMGTACITVYWLCLSETLSAFIPYSAAPGQHTIEYSRSMVFLLLSMFQLFYVLSIRSTDRTFFELGPFSNYRLTGAVILGTALQFAEIYVPSLQKFFHTVPPASGDLVLVMAVSTSAFVVVEIVKLVRRKWVVS
jgi:Ca2+-transporting ATPase